MKKLFVFIFAASFVLLKMHMAAQERTFSTVCSTPGCRRAIVKAAPLLIVTNSMKEVATAPGSGWSNVVTHVTLVCPMLHTNSYRREFVIQEPTATEDPPLPPPLPRAELQPAVPAGQTNVVPTATIHIIVDRP